MTALHQVSATPAAECDCGFTEDPAFHDQLVAIEGATVPYAASLVVQIISDDDLGTGFDSMFENDPDDFRRFVARHNWVDPVGMALLADNVSFAMGQAYGRKGLRPDQVAQAEPPASHT